MRRRILLLLAVGLGPSGASRAADPVAYTVTFAPSGDAELDGLIRQTASLTALQKKLPAAPFALIGRARADQAQFVVVLHNLGYDAGGVDITVAGKTLDDPALLDDLNQAQAAVAVVVTPHRGRLFHLGRVTAGPLPNGFTATLGVAAGQPARAAPLLAVPAALRTALHNAGYAFATVAPPRAVAAPATGTLDVSYAVDAGPREDIGAIEFAGLARTDPDWLRRHMPLKPGQRYSDTAVAGARESLLSLGVFSAVTPLPQPAPGGAVPILFRVTEQKRHAVTLGGSYATDTGFTLSASWEDRNVFGHAETLTLTAAANGLGGSGSTAPGYDLKGVFAKPDSLSVGQGLSVTLEGLRAFLTAYSRTALLANAALLRPLTPQLTLGYGVGFVTETVEQESVSRSYVLGQLPLTLTYDTADNALAPTGGVDAEVSLTPTKPILGGAGVFVIGQAMGATYLAVERGGRGVLALRAQIGSIQGATQFQVPPDQRFYAGGSASVRGYTYQTVGPLFADDVPEGGNAIDAGTVEFRQRVYKNFGIVPFVDAGQVSAASAPFKGVLSVGAGLGLRYYTGIGPIRVDFAVPVKRTPDSGAFQLYIGLGEAF